MDTEFTAFQLPFGTSQILFDGGLHTVRDTLPKGRLFVVTDNKIAEIYKEELAGFETIIVGQGEASKRLDAIAECARDLLSRGADRGSHLIAFGGGAICDFTGFLASVYMRGIGFSFVPTTLLAQVDAAIGGKTAINLPPYKNMLGTFAAPELICINPAYTTTQDMADWVGGLAETVKHAAISDAGLLAWLESNHAAILQQSSVAVTELVRCSATIKMAIVARDPTEGGARKLLNFGHTVGHALELTFNMRHGEAVALGMAAELAISVAHVGLSQAEADRICHLIHTFQLPVNWKDYHPSSWLSAISTDKKRFGNQIDMVVLDGAGSAHLERLDLEYVKHLFSPVS